MLDITPKLTMHLVLDGNGAVSEAKVMNKLDFKNGCLIDNEPAV